MRHHATIHSAIWSDEDFKRLTKEAQHLFFLLISQPQCNLVGALDYLPMRWARMSAGDTLADIEKALAELRSTRFVLTDEDTGEIVVRSMVRYDPPRGWKTLKGMWSCWSAIESPRIRREVLREIPGLAWEDTKALPPAQAYDLVNHGLEAPSQAPSDTPSDGAYQGTPIGRSIDTPPVDATNTHIYPPVPKPKKPKPAEHPDFAHWYRIYPHKMARPDAVKAFTRAISLDSLENIVKGTERFVAYWQLSGTVRALMPYPATFLNRDQWQDDPGDPFVAKSRNTVLQTLLDSLGDEDDPERNQGPHGSHFDPLAELERPDNPGATGPHPF